MAFVSPHTLVKGTDPILSGVKYHLRDINSDVVAGLRRVFEETKHVDEKHQSFVRSHFTVTQGDIFFEKTPKGNELIKADAIVSPANSFGFMDGGIDMVYSKHFGWQLNERLHEMLLDDEYNGELLVGQAVILETNDPNKAIRYLISAPTMRVPLIVSDTANAYLAFRAVQIEVRRHNRLVAAGKKAGSIISTVLCPGLATAIGMMPAETCAVQMYKALENVTLGKVFPHKKLSNYQQEHDTLTQLRGVVPKSFSRR